MSEYKQLRWVCDYCKRDVKRGVMPPPGWQEVRIDFYGNVTHCCPDADCVGKMKLLFKEHGIEIPKWWQTQ